MATSSRVGAYPTIAQAARALHKDPNVLADIRSDDADPYARKRELFAIMAHFSELVMQDLERALTTDGDQLPLLVDSPAGERRAVPWDLGHRSLNTEMTLIDDVGEFHQALNAMQRRTARSVLRPEDSSLGKSAQLPIVARAAELMETLDSPGHKRANNENDLAFVLRNVRIGLEASYDFASDVIRADARAVGAKHPDVTAAEMMEIALRSTGQMRSPAGGNQNQFTAIHDALRTADGAVLIATEDRARPIQDEHMEFNDASGRVGYAVNPQELALRTKDGKVRQVRELENDEFGLKAADGCPARIAVVPGNPPLIRSYIQTLKLTEQHWALTLPTQKPLNLAELGVSAALNRIDKLVLDNLDCNVRVLPSAAGVLSVELSDDTYRENLSITADENTLTITGKQSQNSDIERPDLIIRVPMRGSVKARGVADLSIDFAALVDVDMPPHSRLRCATEKYGSKISLGDGARALVTAEWPNFVHLQQGQGKIVLLAKHLQLPGNDSSVAVHGFTDLNSARIAMLPVESLDVIAENASWLLLHTPLMRGENDFNAVLHDLGQAQGKERNSHRPPAGLPSAPKPPGRRM